MTNKNIIFACRFVIVLAVFALGRITAPSKTTTIQDKTKQTEVEKNVSKKTEIKEKVNPDGSKETTTTIVEDSTTQKKSDSETKKETEVVYSTSRLNISAVAGVRTSGGLPDYGVHISKDVLGPISIGVWGMKSGVIGVSAGLTF